MLSHSLNFICLFCKPQNTHPKLHRADVHRVKTINAELNRHNNNTFDVDERKKMNPKKNKLKSCNTYVGRSYSFFLGSIFRMRL